MPKAGSSRPFDRKSIVAHCRATRTASRIASDSTLTPNLMRLRAAGERRHHAHAFEERLRADQPVGLPDRIDAARLAQIDPAPIGGAPENGNSISPMPTATFFGISPSTTAWLKRADSPVFPAEVEGSAASAKPLARAASAGAGPGRGRGRRGRRSDTIRGRP